MVARPKQKADVVGTYLLAKNSRLFRPGAEFMLADAAPALKKSFPSQDIRSKRPRLGPSGGGGGAVSVVSGTTPGVITFTLRYGLFAPNNPVAWPVGTASVGGVGVPVFSLTNNDGGNFQIDAATGVVSKLTAAVLTTATHSITIAVAGVTPLPANMPAFVPVAASQDFSQPGNSGQGG